MSKPPYTDRQIEIANLLRSSEGMQPEVIDEVLSMVEEDQVASESQSEAIVVDSTQIRMRMMDEMDWKKRAALAAMLISKSLE